MKKRILSMLLALVMVLSMVRRWQRKHLCRKNPWLRL